MPSTRFCLGRADCAFLADSVTSAIRYSNSCEDLTHILESVVREMGFRYYALIDHGALSISKRDRVDIKDYPQPIVEHLINRSNYRRDPVIRACIFSDSAFMWSDLHKIIRLDRRDRCNFELGIQHGLNEGITVPYVRLGECMGSCTFAGTHKPEFVERYLGIAQMIGIFAFQAARRLMRGPKLPVASAPKLHPRSRDCVMLAGRGLSNKEIARALGLTPRTVDGYLTEARRLFGAHDRTELVVSAVLAGEVGLHELRPSQSE